MNIVVDCSSARVVFGARLEIKHGGLYCIHAVLVHVVRTYRGNTCVQVMSLLMNSVSIYNLSEVDFETSNNTRWANTCNPDFLIYLGR